MIIEPYFSISLACPSSFFLSFFLAPSSSFPEGQRHDDINKKRESLFRRGKKEERKRVVVRKKNPVLLHLFLSIIFIMQGNPCIIIIITFYVKL